jgi:taurine dioxygenase
MEFRRLGSALGAEVCDVDLSTELSDADCLQLRQGLAEHELLVFRDQDISAAQQIRFGRCFGEPSVHPFSPNLEERPELIVLDNHRDNPPALTDVWHSDETFRAKPPMATILRACIVPEVGGNTLFASMTSAYDSLSERMKRHIAGLRARHDFTPFRRLLESEPDQRDRLHELSNEYPIQHHPVVRIHPVTGRKTIFVNPQFVIGIDDLDRDEGDMLLGFLYSRARVPEHQYRLEWRPDTLAMWDNRSVQHYAAHDYMPARRRMERVTIAGDTPIADDSTEAPRARVHTETPTGRQGVLNEPQPMRQYKR